MKQTKLKLSHLLVLMMVLVWLPTIKVKAQNLKVSGLVRDDTGTALPGATVLVKGTTNGTVTGIDGSYTLNGLFTTDVLVFSFIGTESKEVTVGNQSTINVTLSEDLLNLEEIVVIGYGTQEQKDITGSIAVIDDKAFKQRPNSQIGSLIQGKAAGVQVLSSSGKPSQGLNIRVRGVNSINAGSEPLYVIDGVPTNDTRSINPADVATISVLKDASSAAIYGAQGANGVVLITTKQGEGGKTKFNFDSYAGFSEVWNQIDVLGSRDYIELMTEMGQSTNWSQYRANTNWQDEVFQRGFSQNYQISTAGKFGPTSFYLSGGWTSQKGAVRSAEMNRSNFKLNLDHEANENLKVGTRIAYTDYHDVDVTDNQNVNSGGVLLGALSTPSIIGIYNDDGTFTSNPFQNWENPIASTDGSDRDYTNQRIIGNAYLEFTPIEGLNFRSNLGIDHSNGQYDFFLDPFLTSYGRALSGRAINSIDKTRYVLFDNTLSYNLIREKHSLELLGGVIGQKFLWENNSITAENFAGNGIRTVNAGSEITNATATKSEKANQSFLSRLNYSFADKYLVTVNFRADGSSVFGPKNRWGYFPSFSLGWRLSEESFFNSSMIEDLKIRAGWGIVGNDQIGNNYAYLGLVGGGANYPIGGVIQPGTYPASISNETLKWEESTQANVGLDVSLMEGRLELTADAYVKRTTDLLLNAPLPRTTGFDNAIQNIGELENKGVELLISSVNTTGEWRWTTDFNISLNRNKVIDLVGQEMFAGPIAGRGEASLVREGLPLGTLFGYVFGGVDPETGDAFYINQEGESTFSPAPEDRVIIGDANPDFIYGMTNNIQYKSFGLTIFFQGSQGNDVLNATKIDLEGMTDPKNQSVAVLERWQSPGDVTNIPRSSWGNTDNSRLSTRFVEDGSYLRLKTLTISYSLPDALMSKMKLGGITVYLTGENLWTLTSYSGFDPEVNAFGYSNTAQGIDYGTYPQTRNLIAGLNLSF